MILIILKSFTIRTALVAALDALDWAASFARDALLEVEKIMSEMKFTSKIIEAVEIKSKKKKKERK